MVKSDIQKQVIFLGVLLVIFLGLLVWGKSTIGITTEYNFYDKAKNSNNTYNSQLIIGELVVANSHLISKKFELKTFIACNNFGNEVYTNYNARVENIGDFEPFFDNTRFINAQAKSTQTYDISIYKSFYPRDENNNYESNFIYLYEIDPNEKYWLLCKDLDVSNSIAKIDLELENKENVSQNK